MCGKKISLLIFFPGLLNYMFGTRERIRVMKVRRAVVQDIEAIHKLIDSYAKEGLLLPRTPFSLYGHIQAITVVEDEGGIIGSGSLHVLGNDLAEIRSLVVQTEKKGLGIGRVIVDSLLKEAGILGVQNVFSMTYQVGFFEKCGFHLTKKEDFPEKIWADCMNCSKFNNCDETAMLIKIDANNSHKILR